MHLSLSNPLVKAILRRRSKQRGDFLIESLIGLLLMAIIGMGVVFVTSRMSVSQKDMRMQEIAVNQMRALLLNNGTGGINLCATPPSVKLPGVADSDIETEVIGCHPTNMTVDMIEVTVGGVSIGQMPKPLFISVTSDALGGEVIVGGSRSES